MTNPLIHRYEKANTVAALFQLDNWGVLELAGKDTRDYLNRISTADMRSLTSGSGIQTLFLQGDGRLIADTVAICVEETRWYILTSAACKEALEAQLDKFLFVEDVKVSDVSHAYAVAMILGEKSGDFINHIRSDSGLESVGGLVVTISMAPAAARAFLVIPTEAVSGIRSKLYEWLESGGGVIGDQDLYEVFRIEDGCPAFGRDMNQKTIPLEASLKPAISFTKGCFPGQEIVARINNLGHPANVLVGLRLPETSEDLVNQPLVLDGKTVGRVTSVTFSCRTGGMIGLGSTKWAQREPGTILTLGESNGLQAVVTELPLAGSAN